MSHEEHIYAEDHTESDVPAKGSNLFVRIVVIIGIILILLFIALAIVKYVPKLISTANVSFSSLFSPKDKMTVTVSNAKVTSGNNFTVNWKNNTTDTEGSYTWSFKCVSGIEVQYNSIAGLRPVICDTLFPLPDDGSSYSFVIKSTNKTPTEVPMSVVFWDTKLDSQKFLGGTSITVMPVGYIDTNSYNPDYANPTGTTATTTSGTTGTTNTSTSGAYTGNSNTGGAYTGTTNTGVADLRVSLYKIGRTTSDGGFQETTSFAENDRVTVRFNVSNIGTARSGTWSLQANLPSKNTNDRVFNSGAQPALNPGDSFELTISFDSFDPNGKYVQIIMSAYDSNQSNNTLSIPVSFNGSYNGGGSYNSTGSKPDLVVRIIDVGVMNNNQFYYSNNLDDNDTIAVKFEVQNIGVSYTGNWRFEADLPTEDNSVFRSSNQNTLAPGEVRQFTIGFDNPEIGENDVVIEVDSDDDVNENSESNNDDSVEIDVDN